MFYNKDYDVRGFVIGAIGKLYMIKRVRAIAPVVLLMIFVRTVVAIDQRILLIFILH